MPSRWCGAQTQSFSVVWQQILSNTLSSFHADFQVFSKGFCQNSFDLFTKGKLSSLAVHNGISMRKSGEEESVSGLSIGRMSCFLWPEDTCAQVNTHNSHSLLICHSNTHIAALISLMNNVILFTACAFKCVTSVTF